MKPLVLIKQNGCGTTAFNRAATPAMIARGSHVLKHKHVKQAGNSTDDPNHHSNNSTRKLAETARRIVREANGTFDFVSTHWPWTVNPTIFQILCGEPNPNFVLIVREPLQRAVSVHVKNARQGKARETWESFETWLNQIAKTSKRTWRQGSAQTTRISWPDKNANIELAIENMKQRVKYVGVTENLDALLQSINVHTKASIANKQENKKIRADEMPTRIAKMAKEIFAADIKLHEEAKRRSQQGPLKRTKPFINNT